MGQIGYFGNERFETSAKKVFSPSGLQRSTASRFQSLEPIGKKPVTQNIGPGLDTVSFSVSLNVSLGVEPRTVLDHWAALADSGTYDVLVVGNKLIGKNKWLLKSVSQTWQRIDGKGRVLAATMELSFEEYVEK